MDVFFYVGLLSGNIGDQCEAIMQFPCLIDQFPLPVLISAAFLKLTDKFVSRYGLYLLSTKVHLSELEK